jgi:rhamnogalacturonan hydrolase
MKLIISWLAGFLLPALIDARLSGSVGQTTSTAHKRSTKQCNILSYGGVASESYDNGPAIASAWAACVSGGEGMLSD